MRNTLVASAFTMLSIATASAQLTIPKEYLPEVHGTIRGKYELQTTNGMQRFQVRNARVSLDGKVLPVIAYKAEIDLSDEGSIKMLDAYARFVPNDTWNVTLGQMRVPFTIDAHRSPHQQYFANRSFIAKQVGNVRDVGEKPNTFIKLMRKTHLMMYMLSTPLSITTCLSRKACSGKFHF